MMNGECDKCGEHALECKCKNTKKNINRKITFEDRKIIEDLLHKNTRHYEICKRIGIHKTSLYREIKKCKEAYNAEFYS